MALTHSYGDEYNQDKIAVTMGEKTREKKKNDMLILIEI